MEFTKADTEHTSLCTTRTLSACTVALVLCVSTGCGPDVVDPSEGATGSGGHPPDVAEPVEVQPWMLGVFSNREPEELTDYPGVQHYYVYDNFEIVTMNVSRGLDDPTDVKRRKWEPRSEDSFAMFRGEDELSSVVTEYLVGPKAGHSSKCGPYEVVTIRGPESSNPGPQPNPEIIIRGAVCQRIVPCPEDTDDGTEGCGGYAMEWCDEPPPPCEDE